MRFTRIHTQCLAGLGLALLLLLSACGAPAAEPAPTQAPAVDEPAATEAPAVVEPAEAGLDAGNPAAFTETITTAGWEFTVLEVLRGDEALAKLEQASAFNGPPDDDALEYVLVRLHVRYNGSATETQRIDPTFFESVGSDGTTYEKPSIVDVRNPEPVLQAELLPGEEAEGWVTVLAPKGDTGVVLAIQPRINGLSTGASDRRYILLGS